MDDKMPLPEREEGKEENEMVSTAAPEREKDQKTAKKAWRKSLSRKQSLLVLLCGVFLIWFFVAALATDSRLFYVWQSVTSPTLLLLNILPIVFVTAAIYALTNRSVFSVSLSAVFFLFMAAVNHFKTILRQDPFIPADFSLVRELVVVLRQFQTAYIVFTAFVFLIVVAALVLAFVGFREEKRPFKLRAVILLAAIVLAWGSYQWLYSDEERYASYETCYYAYFKANEYNSKGFVYSFLVDFHKMQVEPPIGYDAGVYQAKESGKEQDAAAMQREATVKPHVIMIMGEAFADLESPGKISFDGYADPLKNFKALSEDAVYSGSIVVSRFGGGTACTEFEALTGIPTDDVDVNASPYQYVRGNTDSLARFFHREGYDSAAIHPGYSWFYNRSNVYRYLGFEKTVFMEDGFDPASENKSGYISEVATMDRILADFEAHLESDEDPLFLFSVTIQNHGPYEGKYGAETNFNTELDLSAGEIDMMSNYFVGLNDADVQLGRLADYIEDLDEPVVLVYFGDHLPGFTGGLDFYRKLDIGVVPNGTSENLVNLYRTPFFIWQNGAAAKAGVLTPEDIPDPHNYLMKSNNLGATLYALLGYEGAYPYLDAVNALRSDLPLVMKSVFADGDGKFVEEPTEEQLEQLDLLKGWAYYKMFDEEIE